MSTTAFAGRVEELQHLVQRLHRSAAGHPQVVMIEGAVGTGKTALLRVFAERAARRQKASWVLLVEPPDDAPYEPVELAAQRATNKAVYDRIGGRREARESIRSLLPDWINVIPVWGDLIAAVLGTVQALRSRRKRRRPRPLITPDDASEALIEVAEQHPLVLLLDALDRAGEDGLAQLERLLRAAIHGTRLLVVGAYRAPAPGAPPAPIHRLLAALPPGLAETRHLPELQPVELEAWLGKRFPHVRVPPDFAGWLQEQTGGNAAEVDRLLAHLVEIGAIRFEGRRWRVDADAARANGPAQPANGPAVDLSGVAPAVTGTLEAASLLGREFDAVSLATLLERDELYVEDQLAAAAHLGLVEAIGEIDTAEGDVATLYRFRSNHVWASLVRSASPEMRVARDELPAPALEPG